MRLVRLRLNECCPTNRTNPLLAALSPYHLAALHPQGHIVTNYHVIQHARGAQVTLANNRKFEASLRGYEADKDLAVLKIDARPGELVPIQVGVSSRLVVGQRVFAIGESGTGTRWCVHWKAGWCMWLSLHAKLR